MIRVWSINSTKCKLLLVLVLILFYFLLLIFLFVFLQSFCNLLSEDFCNLLSFRFNAKTFLYFSKDIANFRFLLHNCLFSCWLVFLLGSSILFIFFPREFHSSDKVINFRIIEKNWFSTLNARADAFRIYHTSHDFQHVLIWSFSAILMRNEKERRVSWKKILKWS